MILHPKSIRHLYRTLLPHPYNVYNCLPTWNHNSSPGTETFISPQKTQKPHHPTELLFLYIHKTQSHYHSHLFCTPFTILPFLYWVANFLSMASADLMANSSSSCHHNVAPSSFKRKRREAREVRRKVQKLRWVVPGSQGLRREHLFAKTAHYILHLRLKVRALETFLKLQEEA